MGSLSSHQPLRSQLNLTIGVIADEEVRALLNVTIDAAKGHSCAREALYMLLKGWLTVRCMYAQQGSLHLEL